MKPLSAGRDAPVIRTDFSDQAAWQQLREEIGRPVDGFFAYVEFVDDPEYRGLDPAGLLALFPPGHHQGFAFIADGMTMTRPDHPLLVVDLRHAPGREFRAVPSAVQSIENNLSIANMDFEEFAGAVGDDGVFRGFPSP
ncbi:MAG TPA: hypothetical protein VMY76_11345 [Gemmatimonadales bacterium]|nr:hypothetical protein [Gemmatimonadales bacterium]